MEGISDLSAATAILGLDSLKDRDFARLADFIQDYSGIKMPKTKKTMVEGRLRKRLGIVGVSNLNEYCCHLFERGGLEREAIHLIDAVTTNKTEFFREPDHFRFVAQEAVPALLSSYRGNTPLKFWSAASSIGAEAYTISMVLAELAKLDGFKYSVLGTDIATKVLKTAALGIYTEDMVEPIPMSLRQKYLLRGKGKSKGLFRVVPELRRTVQFGRLNLMDPAYPVDQEMDVIFCRNILIYFDKPTQQKVLERLCDHLKSGGYLFLGHSESLNGFGLPLRPAGTTVFCRH